MSAVMRPSGSYWGENIAPRKSVRAPWAAGRGAPGSERSSGRVPTPGPSSRGVSFWASAKNVPSRSPVWNVHVEYTGSSTPVSSARHAGPGSSPGGAPSPALRPVRNAGTRHARQWLFGRRRRGHMIRALNPSTSATGSPWPNAWAHAQRSAGGGRCSALSTRSTGRRLDESNVASTPSSTTTRASHGGAIPSLGPAGAYRHGRSAWTSSMNAKKFHSASGAFGVGYRWRTWFSSIDTMSPGPKNSTSRDGPSSTVSPSSAVALTSIVAVARTWVVWPRVA